MSNINLNIFNLTPDLLTHEELLTALKCRCIKLPNMDTMTKEELVAIFRRVVAPLPQRSSKRGHRRTQITTKDLSLEEKVVSSSCFSIGFGKAGSAINPNIRLKPPPDNAINYQRKKIVLSSPSSVTKCGTDLDKIIINDHRKNQASKSSVAIVMEGIKSKVNEIVLSDCRKSEELLDKIIINDRTKDVNSTRESNIQNNVVKLNCDHTASVQISTESRTTEKPRIKLKRSSNTSPTQQEPQPQVSDAKSIPTKRKKITI